MRLCIHRGTREIGGTCIEVESQDKRIVLDVGLPLDASDASQMPLHPVRGFESPDNSLLGVLISHPHQDHYGLAHRLPKDITFLIGKAAEAILQAADLFTPAGLTLKNVIHLQHKSPIHLGPFEITPFLVDHSAYDSYACLIEAEGKRVFYSGDFRNHGRKSKLIDQLVADPPEADLMLMEGTTILRTDSQAYATEDELVSHFVELIKATDGLTLVWASGQNIDRLVTLFKACRQAKRTLVLDMYTSQILRSIGNQNLPQARWPGVKVFLPGSQRYRIFKEQRFDLSDYFKLYRIFPEEIPAKAAGLVMLFRPSMIRDLDGMKGLQIGRLICSVWQGYLNEERNQRLLDWTRSQSIPIDHCHTSGHADLQALTALRDAFKDTPVIPVHTAAPDQFEATFGNVRRVKDGEWLEV